MQAPSETLVDLENKFWQSLVDQDTDAALQLLSEPSLMVGAHGAMKFDHASYREMAEKGKMVLTAFELSEVNVVFPNEAVAIVTYHVKQELKPRGDGKNAVQEMNDSSTWVKAGDKWQCVMHTETPAGGKPASH